MHIASAVGTPCGVVGLDALASGVLVRSCGDSIRSSIAAVAFIRPVQERGELHEVIAVREVFAAANGFPCREAERQGKG